MRAKSADILVVEGPAAPLDAVARLFPERGVAAWADGEEGNERAEALIVPDAYALDGAMLDRLPRLRALGVLGTGLDSVDAAALRARNVALCTAEGAFDTAIVEYVLLAALTLVRRAFGDDADVGGELTGRTFGLLGVDRAARGVAYGARALGMNVVGHAPGVPPSAAIWRDIEPLARPDLLRAADVLSLHPPRAGDLASHYLSGTDIDGLKPGAVVIDASGRGCPDEAALVKALDGGRIAGAALDRPGEAHPKLLRSDGRATRTREGGPRVAALVARKVRVVLDRIN